MNAYILEKEIEITLVSVNNILNIVDVHSHHENEKYNLPIFICRIIDVPIDRPFATYATLVYSDQKARAIIVQAQTRDASVLPPFLPLSVSSDRLPKSLDYFRTNRVFLYFCHSFKCIFDCAPY